MPSSSVACGTGDTKCKTFLHNRNPHPLNASCTGEEPQFKNFSDGTLNFTYPTT